MIEPLDAGQRTNHHWKCNELVHITSKQKRRVANLAGGSKVVAKELKNENEGETTEE